MKILAFTTGLCLMVSCIHAQETTASGVLNQEASWQALQSRINATNGNVTALRVDVDAISNCADKNQIWSRSKGCIPVGEGMRWRQEGIYSASFGSISTPWWRYEKSLKAANVTQACKLGKSRSYPKPDKYVSNTKFSEEAIMGFPCLNLNDRCYSIEGNAAVPSQVTVHVCK